MTSVGGAVGVLPPQEVAQAVGDEGAAEPAEALQHVRVDADDDAGSGGGQLTRQGQLGRIRARFAFGTRCMNTNTTLASRLASRTAARVWPRSIALASQGRVPVATQGEGSSATWETPMTAIVALLIVVRCGPTPRRR